MTNKYKVWCKNRNQWETHSVALTPSGVLLHENVNGIRTVLNQDSHIICFAMGLFDKNGKEIYVGHVVTYLDDSNTPQRGVIVWGIASCAYYAEAINGDDEGNQDILLHCDYDIEIIGHKFTNPELLK